MSDLYELKLNQLELEKEELEYYKLKYKRKLEKFKQEKRNFHAKLQQFASKGTPQETDESMVASYPESDSEVLILSPKTLGSPLRDFSLQTVLQEEFNELKKEKDTLHSLLQQLELEKSKYKREKSKMRVHCSILKNSRAASEQYPKLDEQLAVGRKSQSEEKLKVVSEASR